MNKNYLVHYGILGMKWGVRRSQAQLSGTRGKTKKRTWSEDAQTAATLKKKSASQLTNAELRKINERAQLESQYRQFNKTRLEKGLAFAATATAAMGTILTLHSTGTKAISLGNKLVDSLGNWVIKDMLKHA